MITDLDQLGDAVFTIDSCTGTELVTVCLPEHAGDLADLKVKVANRANDGDLGNRAKDAELASPNNVGAVGNLDEDAS